MASLQGEHVFNSLGSLVQEFEELLINSINQNASEELREKANSDIINLLELSGRFKIDRNNLNFRTGDKGDVRNSDRYSDFAKETRVGIKNMLSENPSKQTQGYTALNKLLDDIGYYTIDEIAKESARGLVSASRRNQFDSWFDETSTLLYKSYESLINAGISVNKTRV